MNIKIKLFAAVRESAGREEVTLDVETPSCAVVFASLKDAMPALAHLIDSSMMAVNGAYAHPDAPIHPDDEVALLPPVSGG